MSVSQAKKPPFIASPIFPFAKKKKTGKKLKKWVHTFSNSNSVDINLQVKKA